jgi:septum formation protein
MRDFSEYNIILASGSPRRKQLMEEMGLRFSVKKTNTDEYFPSFLSPWEAAIYISKKKAEFFEESKLKSNDIIITADTVVSLNESVIPKPSNRDEAIQFLKFLSGNMHQVYTAITLKGKEFSKTILSGSKVWFRKMSDSEIEYYVDNFNPYDKAGGYGVQDWIGITCIERIEGSYNNIVGLPTALLYETLLEITNKE